MYKLNERDMFYDMEDGQAVVINSQSGSYFGFSPLGSEVLDRLLKGCDPVRILAGLQKLPGCPGGMKENLDAFIGKLKDAHILEAGETRDAFDEFKEESVAGEGFALEMTEYDEIQELILADPIHDVDEDASWPEIKGGTR